MASIQNYVRIRRRRLVPAYQEVNLEQGIGRPAAAKMGSALEIALDTLVRLVILVLGHVWHCTNLD